MTRRDRDAERPPGGDATNGKVPRPEGPVVELSGVSFGYTSRPVVRDVSVSVGGGEFLGLVGPNGSGKSTLLKLMIGLLEPDSGRAELFGEPARAFDDGRRVGYVAQDRTATVDMPITVAEVVRMGRFPHAGYGRIDDLDRQRVREALDNVGMEGLADRRFSHLSGGQRQRTYVARALAADADLLALDEPTVGVDAEKVEAFYDLLTDLNDRGMTVVLVEHDLAAVVERASRVLCLDREVRYLGDPEGFLESDALADVYGTSLLAAEREDRTSGRRARGNQR